MFVSSWAETKPGPPLNAHAHFSTGLAGEAATAATVFFHTMPRKPKRKAPASPSPATLDTSPEPYPSHASPSPAQCLAVRDALLAFHGFPEEFAPFRLLRLGGGSPEDGSGDNRPPPSPTVLDGLVTTLLSQNTTEVISRRAFTSLKAAFPSWDQVSVNYYSVLTSGQLTSTPSRRRFYNLRTLNISSSFPGLFWRWWTRRGRG